LGKIKDCKTLKRILFFQVAMRIHISFLLLGAMIAGAVFLRPPARLSVVSPESGDILQGVVPVTGSTVVTGFKSYEVSFTFDREDSNSWFLIQQSNEPVQDGNLAVWDTTTITDGDYRIRVLVSLENGQTEELIISGLRVRNYTPVEFPTVAFAEKTETIEPVGTIPVLSITQPSVSTPLAQNPARVSLSVLVSSLTGGLVFVAALFIFLGLYLAIQSNRRRRK
jgi:hypothetical protein